MQRLYRFCEHHLTTSIVKKYFSWERYFTELLTEKTSRTYLNYTKKTLNEAYLNDGTKNAILRQMGKLKID